MWSAWWWIPQSRRRQLRTRPTRGSPIGRSRSWSRWPSARASNCARAICAWPSAPPSWWGAIHMPTSSSAPGASSNSCAPGSAASSGTFAARSKAIAHARSALARCSISRCGFAIKSSASADRRSTRCTPEVECIGRGKARAPYEFGCKVSIATPATAPKGGQFVLHAKALHGNPYDGHTLGPVIADLERLTGAAVRRIHGDKGYRGHNYPDRFKVWISGQVRRVTKAIRREMRRRAAVEPVIGHLKDDHRMRRNYLKGRDGDRINAVLAAAGYNFSLLLRWFEELLRVLLLIICRSRSPRLLLG